VKVYHQQLGIMAGKEEVPTTPFSIQNILSNKGFDGVWTTILSNQMDSSSGRDSDERNSRHAWDVEALDMRMKNQIKGELSSFNFTNYDKWF